jgi:two-component system nitrate/nitrite response regulator NarL
LRAVKSFGVTVLASIGEPVVQIGLKAILDADPEFELVGLVNNDADLISHAAVHQPHVIMYSLNLELGQSVVQDLRRVAPQSAIVLWGHAFSTDLAYQAMDMKVQGMLSTTSRPESLKECLRVAAEGRRWMEQSLSTALLNAQRVTLSRRQSQILALLVQGLKNKEIATHLGISEGTVKCYLTKLFEKVGAKDRFELALFGLRNLRGLLDSGLQKPARPFQPVQSNVKVIPARRVVA